MTRLLVVGSDGERLAAIEMNDGSVELVYLPARLSGLRVQMTDALLKHTLASFYEKGATVSELEANP